MTDVLKKKKKIHNSLLLLHNLIMHPQILLTWPLGRQALDIRIHNLNQDSRKRNLFSQNWSDNDAKKNSTILLICMCQRQDAQNW